MSLPAIGAVDPLAIAALVFLVLVLGVTIGLFVWLMAPHRRTRS